VVSRVAVFQNASTNLIARVNVYYTPSAFNLVSRVLVRGLGTSNLVCKTIVFKETSTSLVSRMHVCPSIDNSISMNSIVRAYINVYSRA
jgi:hypothetical protein